MEKVVFNKNITGLSRDLKESDFTFNLKKLKVKERMRMKNLRRLKFSEFEEQLILFDKVALKVERFNTTLILLHMHYGYQGIMELLYRDAISFVLWSPMILSFGGRVNDEGKIITDTIHEKPPLASGSLTGDDLDPEKNLFHALQHLPYSQSEKNELVRKAKESYLVPNSTLSKQCLELTYEAYKEGYFDDLGIDIKDPKDLTIKERNSLQDMGNSMIETIFLIDESFGAYQEPNSYNVASSIMNKIMQPLRVHDNTEEIFDFENILDIQSIIRKNNLDLSSVFEIRESRETSVYKKWIHRQTENVDGIEITEEYKKAISKFPFLKSKKGKSLRGISVWAIGLAISQLVDPITGMVTGLTANQINSLIVDGIVRGKSPKMFLERMRSSTS